jgi:hypothetical protein
VQRQLGHAHPLVTSIYAQFVDESYADMADGLVRRPDATASKQRPSRRKRVSHSRGD